MMDFSSQKFYDDINIPVIVNKLLKQQRGIQPQFEEKLSSFIPRHKKTNSLPEGTVNRNELHKSEYGKMKRTLYDHNRSLRHYDYSFSINTILERHQEKSFSVKMQSRAKTKSIKIRPRFGDVIKKTEKLFENSKENIEKDKIKSFNKLKIKTISKTKKFVPSHIDLPLIRAQTILPSSRTRYNSNMIDQEISTDGHNYIPYM